MPSRKQISYRDAGVDIDEAGRAVSLIRKHARATFTQGVLTDIGSFGAGFQLSGFKQPVLISSADGVGTKLKIAFLAGRDFDERDTPILPVSPSSTSRSSGSSSKAPIPSADRSASTPAPASRRPLTRWSA